LLKKRRKTLGGYFSAARCSDTWSYDRTFWI